MNIQIDENENSVTLDGIKYVKHNTEFDNIESGSLQNQFIGQYVIIRSRNEGINAGVLIAADETGALIKDARRIWYHKPADPKTSWYEGVSQSGLSKDSKISCPVDYKVIIEDYSITICTEKATESIKTYPSNES